MSSYMGRHAEWYDVFYSEKDYAGEVQYLHQVFLKYGQERVKRVLELACGTGTHALLLEQKGYEMQGTDYSESMIREARKKALAASSSVTFDIQDMCHLPVYNKPFDAVICLFDSIGYALTNEKIQNLLKGVYHNLKENGLFIFEFWHAAAMIKSFDPVRVKHFKAADTELIRISETSIDSKNQVSTVNYTILELHKNGQYAKLNETQRNRFFLIQEIKLFLGYGGFEVIAFFNGFSEKKAIDEHTWHIVAVAKKRSGT